MRIDSSADTGISFLGDKLDQPVKGNFNQLFKLKQKHPNIKILITIGGYVRLCSIYLIECYNLVFSFSYTLGEFV